VFLEVDYVDDSIRQSRWRAFSKKKKIMLDISLEEAINGIKKFIAPIVDAIKSDEFFEYKWNFKDRKWE
jgi:hypothetical protein